jgi:hypothetical protein
MTKIVQSNYKPKKISRDAVLERIKDGTHIPAQPVYSNDSTGKGDDVHPETKSMANLIDKFEQINAKDKCLRVRFYDWFADYLDRTAIKMRDRASKITNPCSITLPSLKSKKVDETELVKDRSKPDTISMKLPDEDVKKIVPDLIPDDDNIIAVKNATEIANAMIKAGNPPETFKITPDIQRAIEVVAKAEVEYTKTLTHKEKK